jgi:hypothetical protein
MVAKPGAMSIHGFHRCALRHNMDRGRWTTFNGHQRKKAFTLEQRAYLHEPRRQIEMKQSIWA